MRFLASAPGGWLRPFPRAHRGLFPHAFLSRGFRALSAARIPAALVFLALGPAAITVSAQKAPENPTIHVSTHLVRIGVIVRGRNRPVVNLTRDDFVVLDRGKRRKISVFSVEPSTSAAPGKTTPGKSGPQAVRPLPQNTFSDLPQFGTNKPQNVTIVLLDSLNTLAGWLPLGVDGQGSTPEWMEDHAFGRAKDHLVAFLKQLGPKDRIAIYGLGSSLQVLCDFTCDRKQLWAAVDKYHARSQISSSDAQPAGINTPAGKIFNEDANANKRALAARINGNRALTTMEALTAIAGHVADIPGRKNLVWLTANLPFSAEFIARLLARANIAAYPVDARGLLSRESRAQMPASPAAYIRATPAAVASPEPVGIQTMQDIADETGGIAFVNTNDITGAIRKAVEDSEVTYTLGFYIKGRSVDGKFHKLKVEVKRKGLTVRYPKGYFAFKNVPATQEANRANLIAAVRSPIESSVIPLQVTIDRVDKPSPDSLRVSGWIDIAPLELNSDRGLRRGALDLVTVEQDETGKIIAQSADRLHLVLNEKQYALNLKSGVRFHQILQLKPGATTLRYLVEDLRTAKVGSLIVPLSQVKPQESSATAHSHKASH